MNNYYIFFSLLFISNYCIGQSSNDSIGIPFNCSAKKIAFGDEYVYTIVEEMPIYPGGEANFLREIHFKMNTGGQEELQTRITLSFVVDTLGNMINKCIGKTYYNDRLTSLEKNALLSLDNMKQWTPGRQNGKKVPVKFEIPIIIEMH